MVVPLVLGTTPPHLNKNLAVPFNAVAAGGAQSIPINTEYKIQGIK
jgi:hypothetical protein